MNAAPVIALDHPVALDATRVGDDAAALAAARAAGLPVGPGVVLTSGWNTGDAATAEMMWQIVSHDGAIELTIRPSPVGAGALEPATIVRSAAELLSAAREVRAANGPDIAVLVQTVLPEDWRGVLVADDSGTSGWHRRLLLHAARAGGDWIAELDGAGRVRRVLAGEQLEHPPVAVLARLSRLSERLTDVLGGATDIEFAVHDGRVRALHVRSRDAATNVEEHQLEPAA